MTDEKEVENITQKIVDIIKYCKGLSTEEAIIACNTAQAFFQKKLEIQQLISLQEQIWKNSGTQKTH